MAKKSDANKNLQPTTQEAIPPTGLTPKPASAPLAIVPPPAHTTAVMSRQDELFSVARMIQAMSKQESCQNPNGNDFVKGDLILYPQRIKLGDYKTPVSVIFLRNTLEWANFEIVGPKEEWRNEEPRIDLPEEKGGNEHWPLEFMHDGKKMKRYRQITLFLLLPFQVEAFLKDALSDAPSLSGSISPIAIKTRNYSRRAAQEILGVIGSKEFTARNQLRTSQGLPPIPVYAYEHVLQVQDKTNARGTFQVLTYKKSEAVKNPEVKAMAKMAYDLIAAQTELKTVVLEESQEAGSSRGEVSDEV
jgi:hypothetical protein